MRVTKGPYRTRTVRLAVDELYLEQIQEGSQPAEEFYRLEIHDDRGNRIVVDLDGIHVRDILADAGLPVTTAPCPEPSLN